MAVRLLPPITIRPVNATSAGPKGAGGTKRSALLVALPNGVATENRPDVAFVGTVVVIVVLLEEFTGESLSRWKVTLLLV